MKRFEFVGNPIGVDALTEAKSILGKRSVDNMQVGHSVKFQGVDKKERNAVVFEVRRVK